ncbi:hypothetical protein GCM10023354_13850 [Garicola koreensis]|uniref:hypothetical protein n=1 Tax=Garicola koreensis TaxID=1262554 RepID=UPI0031ECE36A
MSKFLSISLTVIVAVVAIRVLLWVLNVTIHLVGNLIFLALIIAAGIWLVRAFRSRSSG